MKVCENCGNEHEGTYGSGRFCSTKCSRGFSTKAKRTEINEKVSSKLKTSYNVVLICKQCHGEFTISSSKKKQDCCSKKCASIRKGGWNNHDKVDWSKVHKEAYAKGNNFVAGGTTPWIKYKDIKVQGSYEVRMCEILDEQKKLGKIKDWEYSTTRIKYEYKGKIRTYLIDFTIINLDNTRRCIEVKGRETELDYVKWEAAKNQGILLEIWRKTDLFKL
jgi:hypothetical protein